MAEIKDGKLYVKTPVGTLVAYSGGEPDFPGICIDLYRDGVSFNAPLALTEYTSTEGDLVGKDYIITYIWKTVTENEYSKRIVHTNIDQFFAGSENKGQLLEVEENNIRDSFCLQGSSSDTTILIERVMLALKKVRDSLIHIFQKCFAQK